MAKFYGGGGGSASGSVTITNAAGASAVNIQDGGNSITVDGAVTETNSAAELLALQDIQSKTAISTDQTPFAVGGSKGNLMMAEADDTGPDSVSEGDIGALRMSLDRKMLTAGDYVDDTPFTPAGAQSYVHLLGAEADETAPDSVDEGDVGALRMTLTRFLKTSLGDLLAGEDLTNNKMVVEHQYSGTQCTGDTQVKASAGFLHCIIVQSTDAVPTAGSIIVYDNTAESGTQVCNIDINAVADVGSGTVYSVLIDRVMTTGIYVGFTTTADVAVQAIYR